VHVKVNDFSQPPMNKWGGGWDEDLVLRNGQYMARFTGIVKWPEADQAASWYQEFAERIAGDDYERLGLVLDAMQLIALGGSDSRALYLTPPKPKPRQKRV
jgi:hypothetical protein